MFELMLLAAAALAIAGIFLAYDGSRDVFHPLVFIGPMFVFLYAWMPWKLLQHNGLEQFFDNDQLWFVQTLNILGIAAFVIGCLAMGVRFRRKQRATPPVTLTPRVLRRLMIGACVLGSVGLACWMITIINVGGFNAAFSSAYGGGYDDSGYVRDGAMLLLVALLLIMTSLSSGGPRITGIALALVFGLPWAASALLMGRRGPTFSLAVVLVMGWYFGRTKRPPLLLVAVGGFALGWFVLFLVTNRTQIYLGSSFDMKTGVASGLEKPDTGNEYIYGSGTVLSAKRHDRYFWMRRYLAQILIRPIPSAIWPTKYEDFGVPELLFNAGTGEGFGDALGWVGAVGSAPGIIADLFVEAWWLAVPLMAILGIAFAFVWQRAVTRGGPWSTQYTILAALSIYLVMQTGEAVIFRSVELSIPCWLAWLWALQAPASQRVPARYFSPRQISAMRMASRHVASTTELIYRFNPTTVKGSLQMPKQNTSVRCHVAVAWIDWYPYHVARFRGLVSAFADNVAGIELVGGVGVHAGLKFREELPTELPVTTLMPNVSWREASHARLACLLWRELSRLKPRLVLVPGYYTLPGIAMAIWARVHGADSVLMTESCAFDHARTGWREQLKSLGLRALFNWAVTGGRAHVEYLRQLGFPLERVTGFYDVVDNSFFRKGSTKLREESGAIRAELGLGRVPYFLYVGRMAEEKNVATLLSSWIAYRTAGGTWPLVLVGEGPETKMLRRSAAACPFAADAIFAGLRSSSELLPFYSFAGCLVLPSSREPWGLVVNEAMAAALPVIVSNRCGCAADLLFEGENGFSFDPNNGTELTKLLQGMEALTAEKRTEMGEASARTIQGFSPQSFGHSIFSIAMAMNRSGSIEALTGGSL